MSLMKKTAIVTGSSQGIGATLALRLAADGYQVVVNYPAVVPEHASNAERAVAAITAAGGTAIAVCADVASSVAVTSLFEAAEAAFGPVDVLVNNAGVQKVAPLAQVSDEEFQWLAAVNFAGIFHGLREAARRLRDNGRIISLSTSIVGTYLPGHGVYAATKAAIEAMTRVLAKELGSRGITVNAVAPGPVATELFFTGRSQTLIQRLIDDIPLGRLGRPEDVAAVVSFLAGPDGGWINGQIIKTNGGRN